MRWADDDQQQARSQERRLSSIGPLPQECGPCPCHGGRRARGAAGGPAAPVLGATTAVGGPVAMPTYRYVYQPDRILVIDPYTNIAVQTIPR